MEEVAGIDASLLSVLSARLKCLVAVPQTVAASRGLQAEGGGAVSRLPGR